MRHKKWFFTNAFAPVWFILLKHSDEKKKNFKRGQFFRRFTCLGLTIFSMTLIITLRFPFPVKFREIVVRFISALFVEVRFKPEATKDCIKVLFQ